MYPATNGLPQPRIKPIVKPGASPWRLAIVTPRAGDLTSWRSWVGAGVVFGALGIPIWVGVANPDNALLPLVMLMGWGAALIGIAVAATRHADRYVVRGLAPSFEGVAIEGEALDLLVDIQHRFTWAERMFGQVPTGIRWDEVDEQVGVLMWEAAERAARVSALDVELRGLAYATSGTPQGALRKDLQRLRSDNMASLRETQREADALAREASNAAAAARMALARTGSIYDLEIVSPTGASLIAKGTLAAARARLALLAEAWAELDETGALAAERVTAAQAELELPDPPVRSRRRRRAG